MSLLSFPRDLVDVPLPGGGVFSGKVNSLLAYARRNPAAFPGSAGDGHDVLMAAFGEMTGLQIDYYAQVNLGGFVAVVDALGGIEVNVARAFCDPLYDEYGFTRGFSITAGRHKLNGNQALAYARIRKAPANPTSRARRASRRSSRGSATAWSRAASWPTRWASSGRWARPSRPTSRAASCATLVEYARNGGSLRDLPRRS